jgi:hypothetical protein
MSIDDRMLRDLVVESSDLQVDAMRDARRTLPDIREIGRARAAHPDPDRREKVAHFDASRRRILRNGGFGVSGLAARGLLGTAFGSAVMGIVARPVAAQEDIDIMIFNTASSLENVAVAAYGAALTLPFFAENQVIVTFAETTMSQHAEHSAAFNAAAVELGGEEQTGLNPVAQPVVEEALPTLIDYPAVVELAALLEETAQDTYLANLTLFSDPDLRTLMGSVLGVETQHLATLNAVRALLAADVPELIAIPTDVAALPSAAGSVGFPLSFIDKSAASPPEEGAL